MFCHLNQGAKAEILESCSIGTKSSEKVINNSVITEEVITEADGHVYR